jgi:hypothetical protein
MSEEPLDITSSFLSRGGATELPARVPIRKTLVPVDPQSPSQQDLAKLLEGHGNVHRLSWVDSRCSG